MIPFFKISTKNYDPISHEDNYLYIQYDQINSFIERNFIAKYANILAKPNLRSDEVSWLTAQEGPFKRISELSQDDKVQSLKIYWEFKEQVNIKINELQEAKDKDKNNWAFILENVFNEDYNIIFTDKTNIVILWGWKFRNKEENFIPIEDIVTSVQKSHSKPIIKKEPKKDSDGDNKKEPKKIPKVEPKSKSKKPKKNPWWILIINSLWWFIKKFWWLLLIIFLVIVLSKLLRTCDRDPSNYNSPFDSHTEEYFNHNDEYYNDKGDNYILIDDKEIIEGKPIPIDNPDDIIIDNEENDYEQIIPDRINIALKRKNKDKTILQFIEEFVKIYPKHEILFYRKEAKLLQIKVPEKQRVQLKKEIKDRFKNLGYDLLIWDEVIFNTNNYDNYNDPVFNNSVRRWHFDAIGAEKAWEITKGSNDIIIAIIDDGFDLKHEDFSKDYFKPWNVYTQDSSVYANNDTSHGTHVAGLALADQNNRKGTSGIAPNCRFMPIQIGNGEIGFTSISIIEGILYAINNKANVINLSIAKYFPNNIHQLTNEEQNYLRNTISLDEAEFWSELFQMADEENVSIVLAAGNQNILTGIDAMARSEYSFNVASIDFRHNKSDFSNHSNIYTVVSAPGGSSSGKGVYSCFAKNNYGFLPGTSMAAPIVSGAIGLIKSLKPDISNKEIKKLFQKTGQKIDTNIGPLLQIDKALLYLKSNQDTSELSVNNKTQKRINELRNEINTLLNECPECN